MLYHASRPYPRRTESFLSLVTLILLAAVPGGSALAADSGAGTCVPSTTTLCMDSNRFSVEVDWNDGPVQEQGTVLNQLNDGTGFFVFDDSDAAEVMVKVLDGCLVNGNYWVFGASVSNYGHTITVTDTVLGGQAPYTYTEGVYGAPILDTGALPCDQQLDGEPEDPRETLGGSMVLELADGRFRVDVAYADFSGMTGTGQSISLSDRSGSFWFFSPSNQEALVKVAPNDAGDAFTLVASIVANVEVTVTATDVCGGGVVTFEQPLGTSGVYFDENAFPLDCTPLFTDGFETGNTIEWSASVP